MRRHGLVKKLDPPGVRRPPRSRVNYKSGRRKWKSILGGGKRSVGVDEEDEEEEEGGGGGGHLPASADSHPAPEHTASHDTLHQRGGRHCTESTTLNTHTRRHTHTHTSTHTHTHTTTQGPSLRSTALSWLPEPHCVFQRKNKQTNMNRRHTLDPTGENKKIKQKLNL